MISLSMASSTDSSLTSADCTSPSSAAGGALAASGASVATIASSTTSTAVASASAAEAATAAAATAATAPATTAAPATSAGLGGRLTDLMGTGCEEPARGLSLLGFLSAADLGLADAGLDVSLGLGVSFLTFVSLFATFGFSLASVLTSEVVDLDVDLASAALGLGFINLGLDSAVSLVFVSDLSVLVLGRTSLVSSLGLLGLSSVFLTSLTASSFGLVTGRFLTGSLVSASADFLPVAPADEELEVVPLKLLTLASTTFMLATSFLILSGGVPFTAPFTTDDDDEDDGSFLSAGVSLVTLGLESTLERRISPLSVLELIK